ncbi:MAG: hypothetical protein ABIH38_04655 [Patescibacteria group bacterium]
MESIQTSDAKNPHSLTDCPDCGAKPGQPHKEGCDVERCSNCGGQFISCDCPSRKHDKLFARWTGFWPGDLESKALGLDLNDFYAQGYHKTFFVKPKARKTRKK